MSRPLRIEFPGGYYHLTSRGDGREDIFLDDRDREVFLQVVAEAVGRFGWRLHAYCLMTNHYHLLVETPEANLSRGMRQLNGIYTQRFNRRHNRVGHVFQGRYKAIIVEKDAYFCELARYIVLNPVRAGMVRAAKDWPWSSYRATAGLADVAPWQTIDDVLAYFSKRRFNAQTRYRQFLAEGKVQASPWQNLRGQIYLGGDEFIASMRRLLEADRNWSEIPRSQHRAPPKPLAEYLRENATRDEAIAEAFLSGGYTMKQLGEHVGLHYSRVSRIIRKMVLAKDKT
jgi:REP element-mobilizing transposase RayT